MSTLAIALGTWKRYAPALLVLTAVACLPFAWLALTVSVPADRGDAATMIRFSWVFGATAWMVRYVLVGAIAPAARAVANEQRLSQRAVLMDGMRGLVRAVLPCGLAIAAVIIGGLALAVPGLLLFVLLSMTGASERPGVPAPLLDSIEVARGNLIVVAFVAGGMVLLDLAVVALGYFLFASGLPSKPNAVQLVGVHTLIQIAAIGAIAISPIAASALAAIHARARR